MRSSRRGPASCRASVRIPRRPLPSSTATVAGACTVRFRLVLRLSGASLLDSCALAPLAPAAVAPPRLGLPGKPPALLAVGLLKGAPPTLPAFNSEVLGMEANAVTFLGLPDRLPPVAADAESVAVEGARSSTSLSSSPLLENDTARRVRAPTSGATSGGGTLLGVERGEGDGSACALPPAAASSCSLALRTTVRRDAAAADGAAPARTGFGASGMTGRRGRSLMPLGISAMDTGPAFLCSATLLPMPRWGRTRGTRLGFAASAKDTSLPSTRTLGTNAPGVERGDRGLASMTRALVCEGVARSLDEGTASVCTH